MKNSTMTGVVVYKHDQLKTSKTYQLEHTVMENYNFKAYREKYFDNNSNCLYGYSIVKNAIVF